jgi:hypothetical protein
MIYIRIYRIVMLFNNKLNDVLQYKSSDHVILA